MVQCPPTYKSHSYYSYNRFYLHDNFKIKQRIKILRIFRIVGDQWDPKGEYHDYFSSFRGINTPKSEPFKYKNNAQTLPTQLQYNFEKGQKMSFLATELAKPKILFFGFIYKPLELKIHLKIGLLSPETTLKNFVNDSKIILKK